MKQNNHSSVISHPSLLQHFEKVIDTPDAIPRLRRFILDLAVRGKLVEQDPNDEPAAELLKRIAAEKKRLIAAKKIKKPKALLPIKLEEVPYDIPSKWQWVRIGDTINNHLGGGTPSKSNFNYWGGDIYWASVKDVGKTKYIDTTIDRITQAGLDDSSSNLISKEALIVVTRMGLGKVSINRVPVAINQDLRALLLTSFSEIDYYYIFLKTHSVEGSGLTVKGIKVDELLNFNFSLPPLAEQKRIVAKVDELMALCDRLEAAQAERNNQRKRLVAATHHQINLPAYRQDRPDGKANTTDDHTTDIALPAGRQASFLFHPSNFKLHTSHPQDVSLLRQTILNLAVRGKLVPPACRQAGKTPSTLPSSEPNKWWVYVIECEDGSFYKGHTDNLPRRWKQHCAGTAADWTKAHPPKQFFYWEQCGSKETAIKREKYLKSGSGREWFKREVVDVPEAWEPAAELLKHIATEKERLVKEKKIKKPKALPPIEADEIPFELPSNWQWCRVWDIAEMITSGSRDWAKYYSDRGSIFVTMGNLSRGSYELRMEKVRYVTPPETGEGSRTKLEESDLLISITGDVGNLGLIPPNFGNAYINQHTCLCRFMPFCRNRYFPELMRSPFAKAQFEAPQRGIKNSFRLGDVGEMIIPLPPLAEQKRIVAKVDELMTLCDSLEAQLTTTQSESQQLLEACLNEAIA